MLFYFGHILKEKNNKNENIENFENCEEDDKYCVQCGARNRSSSTDSGSGDEMYKYEEECICPPVIKESHVYSTYLSSYINSLPLSKLAVTVSKNDFIQAVRNIKPSVTLAELQHYDALGREFMDSNI